MFCTGWKNKIGVIVSVCLILCLCGCNQNNADTIQFFSMDTVMQFTAYGENTEQALACARKSVESLDSLLDATDSNSAISQLKNGDKLQTDLLIPLQTAQRVGICTDGALDITLYPLTDAWGFYSKDYHVPAVEQCNTLLKTRGSWSLDGDTLHCDAQTKLDLGSVAKGYAGECAANVLLENQITSAVLSLGGNVQTVGTKPDGSLWTVAVTDPLNTSATVGNLKVGAGAVITSGSYQRYFTENEKTYHHILDPKTGYPAQSGLLSVTVYSENGTVADALSTALFVMGLEKGAEFYQTSDFSYEALYITENKEIYLTKGLSENFEQTSDFYASASLLQ